MLFKEFQERMNRPVDKADFEKASFIFMQSKLDKDAFCKSYQEVIDNPLCLLLVNDLASEVSTLRTRIENSESSVDGYASRVMSVANNLWDVDGASNAVKCLNRLGRDMLGDREYLRRKLSLGYELDLKDRTDIAELL